MRQVDTLLLGPNCWVPNNPGLPVLIYHDVVVANAPEIIEATLRNHGWRPDWRDGVYPYHHYHSTAHEALACTNGSAALMLGGEGGTVVEIAAGDLLVLPAGTGHCRIAATDDFLVVGAYPVGQQWDVCRSAADAAIVRRIAAVALPSADPIDGRAGPLMAHWSVAS